MPGTKWKTRRCFNCGGGFRVRLHRTASYCPYCRSKNICSYVQIIHEFKGVIDDVYPEGVPVVSKV